MACRCIAGRVRRHGPWPHAIPSDIEPICARICAAIERGSRSQNSRLAVPCALIYTRAHLFALEYCVTIMARICEWCGTEYTTSGRGRPSVYCSDECRWAAKASMSAARVRRKRWKDSGHTGPVPITPVGRPPKG